MHTASRQIADRLPAAAALSAERGLNDTKIEDVAAATGVPEATLYYYFAGKEDILAFPSKTCSRRSQARSAASWTAAVAVLTDCTRHLGTAARDGSATGFPPRVDR